MGTKRRGHKETWAQNTTFWGTKRRGHKIPLFWAYRDVGTKRRGHKETWTQRDASAPEMQEAKDHRTSQSSNNQFILQKGSRTGTGHVKPQRKRQNNQIDFIVPSDRNIVKDSEVIAKVDIGSVVEIMSIGLTG